MLPRNQSEITARDLLHAFLDLQSLEPDPDAWSEQRFSDNPPRLVRLRRLVALFRAFGIEWGPAGFMEGRFINPRDSRRYEAVAALMLSEFPEARRTRIGAEAWPHELGGCFAFLFRYRMRVNRVLSFPSGVLEAGGLYRYGYEKAVELNRVIAANVATIDDRLAALINPEARAFTVEELARDYGYPDVDLFEIDCDWC